MKEKKKSNKAKEEEKKRGKRFLYKMVLPVIELTKSN